MDFEKVDGVCQEIVGDECRGELTSLERNLKDALRVAGNIFLPSCSFEVGTLAGRVYLQVRYSYPSINGAFNQCDYNNGAFNQCDYISSKWFLPHGVLNDFDIVESFGNLAGEAVRNFNNANFLYLG